MTLNAPKKSIAILTFVAAVVGLRVEASGQDWRPFDADENGELSFEEFTQLRITQYTALDRNGDGRWTRKEFVQRMADMSMGRTDALRGKFKRWDRDDDGFWDTSEAAQAIEGNFKWLDKNKDGFLAPKEFPKYF